MRFQPLHGGLLARYPFVDRCTAVTTGNTPRRGDPAAASPPLLSAAHKARELGRIVAPTGVRITVDFLRDACLDHRDPRLPRRGARPASTSRLTR